MTAGQRRLDEATAGEAAVWIDRDHAVILDRRPDGRSTAERLERSPAESRTSFELRTIHRVASHDRLVVSGPGGARLGFERTYVAMTHRPDRLVDVEPMTVPTR